MASIASTMAGANGSLQPTHLPQQTLECLFTALDPKSLILSQFGNDHKANLIRLTTESFVMERGPRYKAYADLRESKLRMKNMRQQYQEPESNLSPPKKQVKFQGSFPATPSRRKEWSDLAQSVPDFYAALRKENRKPTSMLPPMMEKSLTPPAASKNSKRYGVGAKSGGSKSANSGEKRTGGLMIRKSYATLEELKGFSSAAANAINGENRGGKGGRGIAKTVLGCRRY